MNARSSLHAVGLAALFASALATPLEAQRGKKAAPPELAPHLGRIDDAREVARERNAPLLVFVIQEGEEANDRFYEGFWKSPKLPPMVERAVLLLVNNGEHDPKTIVDEQEDGTEVQRQVCGRFETPTCADHRRNWDAAFQKFHQNGQMRTPQVICLLPDGEEQGRLFDVPDSVQRVGDLVTMARNRCGEGLTAAEYAIAGPAAERGRRAGASGDWGEALNAWREVVANSPDCPLHVEADAGVAQALEGMMVWLAEAQQQMEDGQVERGYARLVELRALLDDTAHERDAKRAVAAAEKRAEWKERIRAWKTEREAEAVVAELEELLRAGKDSRARTVMRKLLRKYEDTDAAASARRRWPELVDEPSFERAPGP